MTELIWDGKYDKDGRRVAPLRIALPFQTVETVNESAQQRQRAFDLFGGGQDPEWRNRLIWGDKKYVLPALLPEFAGKVDLVYIDPPFDTGADFSFQVQIDGEGFTKEPSVIEQKAYRDTWGRGLESYLQWFYETLILLRELLAPHGSVYVHLDENAAHYAKAVLDEVFGQDNFQREIVWRIGWVSGYKSAAKNWIRNHDVILFYVKDRGNFVFNKEYVPYPQSYVRRGANSRVERKGLPDRGCLERQSFRVRSEG
ncbi:MAG: site-specific DNA-methyltransferase [Actinobacteria bacterium]|nr:site-specific DNA-methyltransferase [Actinomycetota bacterium]